MASAAQSVGKFIARGIVPVAMRLNPQAGGNALRRLLEVAIDGMGRLPSARSAAARQMQRAGGDVEAAISGLIDNHVRLASAQGFVTNLGGAAVLPVMIPANLAGVAVVQARMVAAIAHLRGYDLSDSRVRTALIMCLLGGEEVARRIASGVFPTSPLAVATAPMFDPQLDAQVTQELLSELASRVGGRNIALMVTKRVPLLGGGVGAVIDGMATHQIGQYARGELVRRRALHP
jgi:hypothetical protein